MQRSFSSTARSQHTFEKKNCVCCFGVWWRTGRWRGPGSRTAFLTEAVLDFDAAFEWSNLKLPKLARKATFLRLYCKLWITSSLSKSSPTSLLISAFDGYPTATKLCCWKSRSAKWLQFSSSLESASRKRSGSLSPRMPTRSVHGDSRALDLASRCKWPVSPFARQAFA